LSVAVPVFLKSQRTAVSSNSAGVGCSPLFTFVPHENHFSATSLGICVMLVPVSTGIPRPATLCKWDVGRRFTSTKESKPKNAAGELSGRDEQPETGGHVTRIFTRVTK
jgi:hypothetical protein